MEVAKSKKWKNRFGNNPNKIDKTAVENNGTTMKGDASPYFSSPSPFLK
jgi:hypothetical protein